MKHTCFQRQHDSMQCGIACLAMLCRHYGRKYSLGTLSHYCFATTEGVSMLGISEAAQELGFSTVSGRMTTDILADAALPCILHWNQNHFVVLHKVTGKGRKFHVADPGKGFIKYTKEEFEQHWAVTQPDGTRKGIAMFLEPTEAFYERKKGINEEGEGPSFSFLFGYFKEYRKIFFIIFLTLLVGSLLQLLLPFLTQAIVDRGIRDKDVGLVWLILLGELMIVLGRTAADIIRRRLLLHASMRINISLVSDFFIKLLRLPMPFFDTKLMGDLLQRMGDHSRVQSFLTDQVLNVMFTMLSFFVFGIVLFIYNSLIFAVFLLGSVLYGVWIALFLERRKVLDYEFFEQQAVNQNRTYRFITSMQEIKLQNCEQRRRREWEDTQKDLFHVQMKSLKLQQTQQAGSIFINELKNILITVLAATAVIDGSITLGTMLAVQYIVGQLNSPVEQLMGFIYSLQDVRISLERISEIHRAEDEDGREGLLTSFTGSKSIEFSNVSFKYDPHALKNTLSDITLSIPEGRVTAIVGASGSGKTTLIKLMLGYYKVMGGTLCVAGKDIIGYNLKWWRSRCGVVMQDGVIFSESIARNIAVDDGEPDTERMEQAARIACIHDYIMSLPLRYGTKIGPDGVGLSQGQRQRILIARAVYKNPDFIFLDEATNALDARNEREIVENLDRFYEGRTVVVVAHRLSTVRNADKIVVLDNGRIVEEGTHSTLTAAKGAYYNLVKNQLELGN